jgi:hypothetical protein
MSDRSSADDPPEDSQMVDYTALKTNQVGIVILLLAAFILDLPVLVPLVALAMTVGTIWASAGPFRLLYVHVLRPAGVLRPRPVAEDPAPHRFALGMGAGCLVGSTALLAAGIATAGWAVAWLVILLAGVNVSIGFCAGCFVHYQLRRLGVLGPARREGHA